ncbi:hypothetical protein MRB53_022683 [Persea americana]|uniref:Uncharacterized protein n=1 Tax=Persea americana TaxID=3435 RepID=A0ACC2L7W1_PERAE|nr:hypothetical protein MRB53_022683 [Persea americana]
MWGPAKPKLPPFLLSSSYPVPAHAFNSAATLLLRFRRSSPARGRTQNTKHTVCVLLFVAATTRNMARLLFRSELRSISCYGPIPDRLAYAFSADIEGAIPQQEVTVEHSADIEGAISQQEVTVEHRSISCYGPIPDQLAYAFSADIEGAIPQQEVTAEHRSINCYGPIPDPLAYAFSADIEGAIPQQEVTVEHSADSEGAIPQQEVTVEHRKGREWKLSSLFSGQILCAVAFCTFLLVYEQLGKK